MTWILPRQLHTLAYALDTGALSLDSSEQSQICAQSLFVRSKPSPSAIWLRKWKRDLWTQHLSGRILRPSLGKHFVTAWTSSLGDIPASPSVQPGSAKESKTRGTYGRGLQMEFDFSDPGSASLRTSKDISAWGCPTSSKTWQEWVIERRAAYSARKNAAHRTSESECSSWPTISVNESKNSIGGSQMERNSIPLGTMAAMHGPAVPASSSTDGSRLGLWVTPRNADSRNPGPTNCKPRSMMHLGTQAAKQGQAWAPPRAEMDSGAHQGKPDTLHSQIKAWPTPASSGVTGGPTGLAGGAGNREKLASMLPDAEARAMGCGKLNPRWVETLMGLPVGWTMPSCASPVTIAQTNSGYSATVLSRQQHTERFAHSSKS